MNLSKEIENQYLRYGGFCAECGDYVPPYNPKLKSQAEEFPCRCDEAKIGMCTQCGGTFPKSKTRILSGLEVCDNCAQEDE